jgi:hypothetical protein
MSDAGPDSGNPPLVTVPSAGCGKALTVATGIWVSQPTGCAPGNNNQGTSSCQAIPPGSTVPPKATMGSPEYRGWWVYVPTGYDPNKPYTVIYDTSNCFDSNFFHAGADGYPYYNVDNSQAILVGLDYDTWSYVPGCYDTRDANSNDLLFMPWLMAEIENTFCVDTTREWMSEYGNGDNSLAQQLDCAFPAKFRGQVLVSGTEPGGPGYPGSLPKCNPAPLAAFYVHDFNDPDNSYLNILQGCSRVLQQNGCSNTVCDPLDTTLTTGYPVPSGVTLPPGTVCSQFVGCPAEYPVIFCVTYNQNSGNDMNWGVTTLFWDFINGLSPGPACPAGQGYQNTKCAPCPGGEVVCDSSCVNEQTDPNHCGACGTFCPTNTACTAGTCVCPAGEVVCDGACVNEQTDDNHCGVCAAACPTGATCVGGSCVCPGDQVACNNACVDQRTDPSNCGACNHGCGGSICTAGVCACPTTCAGLCVDEQSDPNFCGACDNACPGSAPVCRSGVCAPN